MSSDEALLKIKSLVDEVEKVKGVFVSVWHNESLSDQMEWKGWREVYEKAMGYIAEKRR
jgi:hypothetical protein